MSTARRRRIVVGVAGLLLVAALIVVIVENNGGRGRPPPPHPAPRTNQVVTGFVSVVAKGGATLQQNAELTLSVTAQTHAGNRVVVAVRTRSRGAESCSDTKGNTYSVNANVNGSFLCSASMTQPLLT